MMMSSASRRVLFIGNSFTNRNDVPALITSLAASAGRTLVTGRVIANGASLRQHWNRGEAQQQIRAGGWDVVVLQEQSTLPIKNRQRFHENVRLFDEVVRAGGARTMLYLTWARRNARETQRELTDGTLTIASELGAAVAPVGIAWERVLAAGPEPDLYDADGSHPSKAGSYLAACVFLTALFDISPEGLPLPKGVGLSEREATLLQRISRGAVSLEG